MVLSVLADGVELNQGAEAAAFLRATDPLLFPSDKFPDPLEDTSSGPGAPDMELIAIPFAFTEHGAGEVPSGPLVSMAAVLLRY